MMQQAGFISIQVKRIIFFSKGMPGSLTPLYRVTDFLFERTPGLNYFAGIIMCAGEKKK
jgi:hypothetical protein